MKPTPERALRFSLALLGVLTVLTSAVAAAIHHLDTRNTDALLGSLRGEEGQATRAMAREITQALSGAASDLAFLAEEAEALTARGGDLDALAALYESFSRSNPIYDQLRLLSPAGRELVRINHRDGVVTRTPETALQDKSARDYFTDALALAAGERLVTPLDFNRENGEIELPRVPVLRFIAPVDSDAGTRHGYVALNYRASTLLRNVVFVGNVAAGDPHIVRGAGTWVLDSAAGDQGDYQLFLIGDRRDFSARYPEAWRAIGAGASGYVHTSEGLFTHMRVSPASLQPVHAEAVAMPWRVPGAPLPENNAGWHLVSHIPPERLETMLARVSIASPRSIALIGALVVLASVFIALFLERYRAGLKHWRLRATVDALTGLVNRDEFDRRLEQALALAARGHRAAAVVFVDLNDFKPLNDEYGHAAGDRALVAVADRLLSACRRSDVVARLGGDEFAVILWEVTGRRDSAKIVDKIETAVAQPLVIEGEEVPLSASVGAGTYPDDGRTTETLLHHADMAMYAQKRRRRALRSQPKAAG